MDIEGKQYEIAYLISPKTKEEEVFGEAGKITGFIQDTANGLIDHIAEPKQIRLAYPINKSRDAYFGWTRFTVKPEALADFEKKLKLEKAIMRYLIVEAEEEPVRTRILRPQAPVALAKPDETPTAGEEKVNMEELNKRLEEILGK
ncbi:MAG: 30S ribosomal protein S6 [bacterium]|nr:30S ribosomal protein S6 [bacterium]